MRLHPKKVRQFITTDIWHVKLSRFPRWQRGGIKMLRIILLAIKDFTRKQLVLRAGALTLFTLMSIVPVVAVVFGIAQGFGLEAYLTAQLKSTFANQPQILENMLTYVHNILGTSRGGIIAGFGFGLLLWAVIQVLSNVESAFNYIWYVETPRTWTRKFTDYLSILLFAPLFIVVSGAMNIFITTEIKTFAREIAFMGSAITNTIVFAIKFVPFLSTIIMFFLLYLVMPNTRVKPKAAWYAGIVTGIVFQLFQWAYIEFQYGVSRYNAIYGSFASIPLFITWLQFSWIIVLVGAEISYSVQNVRDFEAELQNQYISHKTRLLYCIHLMRLIAGRFRKATPAMTASEIAVELEIPVNLCKTLLALLHRHGLLAPTYDQQRKDSVYLPAVDVSFLTIGYIIERVESGGADKSEGDNADYDKIKMRYEAMEKAMMTSDHNRNVLDI